MSLNRLLTIIKERRSVREFSGAPVKDQDIRTLIEAAGHAPSGGNRQAWKFIILKNDKIKSDMARAVKEKTAEIKQGIENNEFRDMFGEYGKNFLVFNRAPVVIVVLYKTGHSVVKHLLSGIETGAGQNGTELISVSMAMQNLLLAAHAMDLGACCMTGPLIAAGEIKKILDIRPPFEIAALIPVGRYEIPPEPVTRKKLDRIIQVLE